MIGAKPATLSSQTVAESLESNEDKEKEEE